THHARARHEALRGRDVALEILIAGERREWIVEPDPRRRAGLEQLAALPRVGLGPRLEPLVDQPAGVHVQLGPDRLREQRELEAPPLRVLASQLLARDSCMTKRDTRP